MDVMDDINITVFATKSVRRIGKFKPKLKSQMQNETHVAKSVSDGRGSQLVPPQISSVDLDSVPAFKTDDVLDLSLVGSPHSEPIESTSESINLVKTPQFDSGLHPDAAPEFPAKLTSCQANTGTSGVHKTSDPSLRACTFSSENGTGRSLQQRKRKNSSCELVVEDEDEVLTNREFLDEPPGRSTVAEENIINEESQVNIEPIVKKVRQKSKKTSNDNEKTDRSREKAKKASGQVTAAKRKKFSHSTRRRRVDKVLLETPEDELDYRNVPLRKLILLREYNERLTKKEEAAANELRLKQSNGNPSVPVSEDETFMSRQGGEYDEEQDTRVIDESNIFFNYQTHMGKTPNKRWSKQDTEKFYEAMQQFGTDFSLIEQVFPNCDRRQLKLKFKKEEKKHPLMLRDVLTNRASCNGNSLFSQVIEHLKRIAAEEKQNADKDEYLTGDEEIEEKEATLNVNDEAAGKFEEEVKDNVGKNEFVEEAQSPVEEAYGSDEDEYKWSPYRSDI